MVRPQNSLACGNRSLGQWQNEMDQLFDAFLRPVRQNGANGWLPPMNVSETENEYRIDVELPGIAADAVNVEIHDGKLTISGERQSEEQSEDRRYHRVEHVYGKFERVLKLGSPVEEESVAAEFNNGVLSVVIPKSEKAKPRRIEVKAS